MSIEELAQLRDKVIATLSDRITSRQKELQSEIARVRDPWTARSQNALWSTWDGSNEWSGVGTMPAWAKALGPNLERYRV
jgi:hypothetical protein